MGLSIRNEEVERMIRQLAERRGSSMVDAIGTAVRHELQRHGVAPLTEEEIERRRAIIRAMQDRVAQLPVLDPRTPDEILGYDEWGLPNWTESLSEQRQSDH